MTDEELKKWYFDWLINIVYANAPFRGISFNKLLQHLHRIPFSYILVRDADRADDGVSLRNCFSHRHELDEYRTACLFESGPCSVLEMMIALAVRCEDIMQNPFLPDQTARWFWDMVLSLGLYSMSDRCYDEDRVESVIYNFLDRNYAPNGQGGLFTIPNCEEDLREVEIWAQMNWHINVMCE